MRRSDRYTQFALAAAKEALEDAGWDDGPPGDPERAACVIGTGIGGIGTLEHQHIIMRDQGAERISPLSIPLLMANAACGRRGDEARPARPVIRHGVRLRGRARTPLAWPSG